MKKILALLLAVCTLLTTAAFSAAADTESIGTAEGRNGEITVHVTIDDGTITAIEAEHSETPGLGDAAIAQLTKDALAAQGAEIDGVSGATFSSQGFIAALSSALEQAEFEGKASAVDENITYNTEADVIVVGGGMAGISAALDCAANGLNVILLEKEGILGGSSIRCDGMLLAGGTSMQAENGIEDSAEAFYQEMLELHTEEYIVPENLKVYTYESANAFDWMVDQGVEFEYIWADHLQTPRSHAAVGGGAGMMSVLIGNLEKYENVTIYKNTRATKLLTEEGAVVGVIAAAKDGSAVEFHAPNTILATGGYAANPDLVLELSGNIMKNYLTDSANNVGDGYFMAKEVGADMLNTVDCLAMNYYPVGYEYIGCWTYDLLFVTPDGIRNFNEMTYVTDRTSDVLHMGYDHEFAILDADDYAIRAEDIDAGIEQGLAFKAESVEELAEQLGMDPVVLKATIDRYNELCDQGSDDDFGKPAEYMNKLEGDTLYALTMEVVVTDTYSGPRINENAQVMNTEGEVIDGLYACGAVSLWEVTDYHYADCGCSILNSAVFGRQAAKDIVAKMAA